MILFLTITIALLTLITALVALFGNTIDDKEPNLIKSIKLKGWVSICFLAAVFVLGGIKEVLVSSESEGKDTKIDGQLNKIADLQSSLNKYQEQSNAIIVRNIGDIKLSQLIENINLENQRFFGEIMPIILNAFPNTPCPEVMNAFDDLDEKMETLYWPEITQKFEEIKEKEKLAKEALEKNPLNQENINDYRNYGIQAEYLVRMSYEKANDLRIEALKKLFLSCPYNE